MRRGSPTAGPENFAACPVILITVPDAGHWVHHVAADFDPAGVVGRHQAASGALIVEGLESEFNGGRIRIKMEVVSGRIGEAWVRDAR